MTTIGTRALMDDIERDVRNRLRRHILKRGGARRVQDEALFERVRAVLGRAIDERNADALLLPELLDSDVEWELQTHLRLTTHRPVVGRVILFVKRRLLLPMTRWLFEYSQENFRRQQRINAVLFACIEDLAIENARLRREANVHEPNRSWSVLVIAARPMKLACVIHRFGADIAGGSESHCRVVAEHLAARSRRHHHHDLREGSRHLEEPLPAAANRRSAACACSGFRSRVARDCTGSWTSAISCSPIARRPPRQEQWFRENGPDAPELLDHLRRHGADYDRVLFWSYRYADVYFGLPLVADRARARADRGRRSADPRRRARAVVRAAGGLPVPDAGGGRRWSAARAPARTPSAIIGCGLDPAPAAATCRGSTASGSPIRSCCIWAASIRTRAATR